MNLSFLDNKTRELLASLEEDFQIEFEYRKIDYCEVFQKNKRAIIYLNPAEVETESIAHELLHIWLNKFPFSIGNHIYLSCRSHKKLSKIFSKTLCDFGIQNFCDHQKMYPKYLEMGYSPEKFLRNALLEKCSIKEISNLKMKFLGMYKSKSINHFIGYLISIYADHIENDYSEHLRLLHEKSDELFEIITDFWKSWKDYSIENNEKAFDSGFELANNFISDMEDWVANKTII